MMPRLCSTPCRVRWPRACSRVRVCRPPRPIAGRPRTDFGSRFPCFRSRATTAALPRPPVTTRCSPRPALSNEPRFAADPARVAPSALPDRRQNRCSLFVWDRSSRGLAFHHALAHAHVSHTTSMSRVCPLRRCMTRPRACRLVRACRPPRGPPYLSLSLNFARAREIFNFSRNSAGTLFTHLNWSDHPKVYMKGPVEPGKKNSAQRQASAVLGWGPIFPSQNRPFNRCPPT
jgi:hypothetical protein